MNDAPIAEAGAPREGQFAKSQRGVMMGAGGALLITIGLYVATPYISWRIDSDAGSVFLTAWLGPLLCLAVAVGAMGNQRFFSRDDIDAAVGGPPSQKARMFQAILQNTLEQAVLAIGVYTVLATMTSWRMNDLPLLMSAAFVVGRIAFAAFYSKGAAGRAFGFGLTAYPTVSGLFYAIWLTAQSWLS